MLRKSALGALLGLALTSLAAAQQAENPVDILGSIKPNWGAAGLDAWINDRGSREVLLGNKIEFHFRADAVGYLSIAYVDSSGTAAVIVPGVDDLSEMIAAGVDLVYPSATAGFQFRAVPPAGSETALIVLTDRPLQPSSLGDADTYGFIESQDSTGLLRRYAAAVNAVAANGLVAVAPIRHMSTARVADDEGTTVAASAPATENVATPAVAAPDSAEPIPASVDVSATAVAGAEAPAGLAEEPTEPAAEPPAAPAAAQQDEVVTAAVQDALPETPDAPAVDVSSTAIAGAGMVVPDELEASAEVLAAEVQAGSPAADAVSAEMPAVEDEIAELAENEITEITEAVPGDQAEAGPEDEAEDEGDTSVASLADRIEEATTVPDISLGVDTPEIPDGGDIADATGISGVTDTLADATEVPDVSIEVESPDIPDSADIADATGITGAAEAIDEATPIPEFPDAPQPVTTSEVLTAAGLPDATSTADVAELAGVPDIPDVPTAPGVGDVIDIPDVPDVPTAGDIVSLPDVPEIPDASDVVSLPDVPDVPDASDVTGNALGRVMSKAQSVPTSGAELSASARQYATATVSRKVFNMVLGGGGGGSSSRSGPEDGPPGVSGVMAQIGSDPDRLDAIAEENPGTIGALRLLSRASDPDLELQLTLNDLEIEMEQSSEVYYCDNVSDCNAIPAGKNACGHPRKFVIYASTTTDVEALNATVRDFNSYDAVRLLAEGEVDAVCADAPAAPTLVCERKICDIAE